MLRVRILYPTLTLIYHSLSDAYTGLTREDKINLYLVRVSEIQHQQRRPLLCVTSYDKQRTVREMPTGVFEKAGAGVNFSVAQGPIFTFRRSFAIGERIGDMKTPRCLNSSPKRSAIKICHLRKFGAASLSSSLFSPGTPD